MAEHDTASITLWITCSVILHSPLASQCLVEGTHLFVHFFCCSRCEEWSCPDFRGDIYNVLLNVVHQSGCVISLMGPSFPPPSVERAAASLAMTRVVTCLVGCFNPGAQFDNDLCWII